MRSFRHIILASLGFLLTMACQEIIELPLKQDQQRVVIEALITDQTDFTSIKVARSLNYYDSGKMAPISNAEVLILDKNANVLESFSYSSEDSLYKSQNGFTAEAGTAYTLQISVDGEVYEANGTLIENAQLDSLYYLSKEELEAQGQNVFDGDYFLFVDGSLSSDTIEFFQLKVTVNDTLRDNRGDVANSILSSRFFESDFTALQIPGAFEAEDSISISLLTLNADGFQYYNEFVNLLFNDGGLFSPPPVNPTNNIRNQTKPENYALGFVQFSSVLSRDIYIDEEIKE